MSMQASVRIEGSGCADYESNMLPYVSDLFEKIKAEVGQPTPLAFCSDEDALGDDIQAELEDQGVDDDDWVDQEEALLNARGQFFDAKPAIVAITAYRNYFQRRDGQKYEIGRYVAKSEDFVDDLTALLASVEQAAKQGKRFRIFMG